MKSIASIFYLIIGLSLVASCQPSTSGYQIDDGSIVFANVNIIDVETGEVRQGHVVVDSVYIQRILSPDTALDHEGATIIDASNKYMMPGLAEMHAHVPSLPYNDPKMKETLFLYLSNGVTTIRGMLGHPHHLELREKINTQEILGPRLYTSSPAISGGAIPDVETAREKVRAYHDEGYDFLKILPGLQLDVFDEVVNTANEVGIPFAGHVPTMVGIRHALESKYATVDHLDAYLEGLVPESANVDPNKNGFFGFYFTDLADTTLIPELVKLSKDNGVWVVPTQSLFDRWFSPTDPTLIDQEDEMQYMSPETRSNWIKSKTNLIADPQYDSARFAKFTDIRYRLIRALHKDGQGLLLGSDAPQVFNVPGFSIHHELQGIINAGLTPLEAIQTGTINPASFYGEKFGQIKEGYEADFILLESNPLENIENLKKPWGVMARGKWLDRETINSRLQQIAANYATNQ
ncbi:MAG TPA: amidohydrolase family protein [Cyclobacteriaceae bacterium]|nr:amidohydrolase family protein [Cyclobacteriaceae bacterium]